MNRFFWLIGIVLLVGTLVGVGFGFNHPQPTTAEIAAPPAIMAVGYVDGEFGVTKLHPQQTGKVEFVIAEGTAVKKDDVILQLEEKIAKSKRKEAEAALKAAKALLSQAEQLPKQKDLKLEQQQAAIRGATLKKQAADNELKAKLEQAKGGIDVNKTLIQSYEQKVAEIAELVNVEEAKLKEIELIKPDVEKSRAEADVAAKEALLEQAQWSLDQCKVLAPSDGTVLRVHVNAKEVLGPNPPRAAIEFLPKGDLIVRAEVLQEWANRAKKGQEVDITDDTYLGPTVKGEVSSIAPWFTQKRNLIIEPFTYNDVRYLECVVRIKSSDPQQPPLRVGQRVRVKIKS